MSKPAKPKPPARRPSAPARKPPRAAAAESADKTLKIAGWQAVSALFRQAPERVLRLYFDDRRKIAAGPFVAQMAKMHRPYRLLDDEELAKVAGAVLHGGIVAAATAPALPELDLATARRWARDGKPLVILDGVGNSHNLGAIARTMAFFGLEHLALSDHPAQAALSNSAYRVAEGGLEFLHVVRAPKLPQLLKQLRHDYLTLATALGERARPLAALPADPRPPALVLGNEEQGLPPATLAACESVVTLPGCGKVQSLNVAATAAILIHALAQKA